MEDVVVQKKVNISTLIGLAVVLTLIAGLLLSLSNIAKQQRMYAISSYQECKDAGYPIMESYPEQCRTPDGRAFVNDAAYVPPVVEQQATTTVTQSECIRGGCSQQLCVSSKSAQGSASTCEYRPEYACYSDAKCELQASGECGWTPSPALAACLKNPPPGGAPQVN